MFQSTTSKIGSVFLPWHSDRSYSEISEEQDIEINDEEKIVMDSLAAPQPNLHFPSSKPKITWLLVGLLAVASIVTASLVFGGQKRKPIVREKEEVCGSTPTEARLKGCRFEPMLTAWAPAACTYPGMIKEFADIFGDMHTDWPWWWDANLTEPVTATEVGLLQAGNYTTIYTTHRHSHSQHCLYCFRKIAYALENSFPMMDVKCRSFDHIRHCTDFMANGVNGWMTGNDQTPEIWKYNLLFHPCTPLVPTEDIRE
jgi:hypothetical protein